MKTLLALSLMVLTIASCDEKPTYAPAMHNVINDPLGDCFPANNNVKPMTNNNMVIGRAAYNSGNGSCNVLIGENTTTPDGASYFLNIHNTICMDMRTEKRVKCPKYGIGK